MTSLTLDYKVTHEPTEDPSKPWVVVNVDGEPVADFAKRTDAVRFATRAGADLLQERLIELASRCKSVDRLRAAIRALEGTA